jgi:hypothetical protein
MLGPFCGFQFNGKHFIHLISRSFSIRRSLIPRDQLRLQSIIISLQIADYLREIVENVIPFGKQVKFVLTNRLRSAHCIERWLLDL